MASQYPTTIAVEDLPKWAEISDADLAKDIEDTEAEITTWQAKADAFMVLANADDTHPTERKMHDFRAGAYRDRVRNGTAFLAFLRLLQTTREGA